MKSLIRIEFFFAIFKFVFDFFQTIFKLFILHFFVGQLHLRISLVRSLFKIYSYLQKVSIKIYSNLQKAIFFILCLVATASVTNSLFQLFYDVQIIYKILKIGYRKNDKFFIGI